MASASRDANRVTTLLGVSSTDGVTPVPIYADPTTHRLYVTATTQIATGLITAGTNVTITGSGTSGSPYVINSSGGSSGLTVGTTAITLGTTTRILYDNAGTLGEYSVIPVALGGTNATSASITAFNNITGYTASGATGTTSTNLVFSTSPVLTTPTLGVASATSLATSAASPFLLTNGQLVTIALTSQTVGGTTLTIPNFASVSDTFVFTTLAQTLSNKTFVAPVLGAATATSINGLTISSSTGTLTVTNAKTFSASNSITVAGTDGKTLTVSNSLTLAGTDSTTMTFPTTSASIARTDAAQTFTGTQTFSQIVTTNNAIAASGNAATVPITSRISTVTNNSAATLTITITTTSAVDGQMIMVRILDASAVAQTITWVNTENSTISVPTTSNGSQTLPLTCGFQFNGNTSKWRIIATA